MIGKRMDCGVSQDLFDAAFVEGGFLTKLASELAPPVSDNITTTVQRVLDELASSAGCDRCRLDTLSQHVAPGSAAHAGVHGQASR